MSVSLSQRSVPFVLALFFGATPARAVEGEGSPSVGAIPQGTDALPTDGGNANAAENASSRSGESVADAAPVAATPASAPPEPIRATPEPAAGEPAKPANGKRETTGKRKGDENDDGRGEAGSGVEWDWHARMYVQSRWQREEPKSELALDSARLGVKGKRKRLSGEVEVELADRDEEGNPRVKPTDAFLRLKVAPQLRVRLGQFKRPFSLFRLESRGDLASIERPMVNERLVSEWGYGGRSPGGEVSGQLGKKAGLAYAAALTASERNGDAPGDFSARLTYGWRGWGAVGASWSQQDQEAFGRVNAASLDGRWEHGPAKLLVEGLAAQEPGTSRARWWAGASAVASLRLPIASQWEWEPVLVGDLLQPYEQPARRAWQVGGGANVVYAGCGRLMLQGGQKREGDSKSPWLTLQGALEL